MNGEGLSGLMREESLEVRENEIKAICIFVSCIKNIKYIKENNKNKLFINKIIILHFFIKIHSL